MSFAGTAQNRHILLSFQVQSSFTIAGIRCSARRCSPNDCIAVEAAREAWCVYCRITPGLWYRRGCPRAKRARAVSLQRSVRFRYRRCSNGGPPSMHCRWLAAPPRFAPRGTQWRRLTMMERRRASAKSKVRQLELAWEVLIGWEELPAQIQLQLRDELARLLRQLAAGGEVDDDDAEC